MGTKSTQNPKVDNAHERGVKSTAGHETGRALFRPEVLLHRSNPWLAKPSLSVPVSFTVYSVSAISLLCMIAAFLAFCSYAPSESATAVIVPSTGIRKIEAGVEGTVAMRYVREGQMVRAGAPLVAVRTTKESNAENDLVMEGGLPVPDELLDLRNGQPAGEAISAQTNSDESRSGANADANSIDIKSPVDGVVYQLSKDVGDTFFDFESLASIATNGDLVVPVYVSSAVQARIEIGSSVRMELQAFKGRKIGMLNGEIAALSTGPTDAREIPDRRQEPGPFYKVTIRINQESSTLPREKLLGKAVTVKMPMERRKLYQWLLDPLQSLFRS